MRDREQLELTVSEYHDAKRAERQRTLVQLLTALTAAHKDPWYVWVKNRQDRVHDHHARRVDGKPAACPVPGCRAVE